MKYTALLIITLAWCSCSTAPVKETPVAIKSEGVDISYNREGTGDTAIVFVHGWAINKTYWQSQQDLLSKRFTTVALDLGGHGESGKNRDSWTVFDYANDVIALINGLDLKKVILVGHSMSGDVISAVADSIPQKIVGFIGIDNFKNISTSYTAEDQQNFDGFIRLLHRNYDSVITAFCYASLFPADYRDSSAMKKVVDDVLKTDTSVSIKTIDAMLRTGITEGDRLKRVNLPVHVITSAYAPVNKDTMAVYCVKGLKEKVIDGTGHYPMIEQPEVFNRLLLETIDEIAAGK